jgi:DNA uptake protein ComE-like DNA-binding protein
MKRQIALLKTIVALAAAVGFTATAFAQAGRGLADFNVAVEKDLLALPHLNAALAREILDQRPFLSITNLDAVLSKSLSKEQRTELYGKAFIHVNLNTAPRAELLLIPGLGNRMAHEFEEYRPYKLLAQFRREIGKYVDAKEVARLEQYVFLPIKLNTASDEEILTIPGLGSRMLHEFKEYRPYKNIEQFRREMGKYVDKKEVARLERYVVVE